MILPNFYTIDLEGIRHKDVSKKFLQGMANRMGVSHHKYGPAEDSYPHKVNAIECLKQRLDMYLQDGNTEHLIDVANFAMIEFMYPSHVDAHFEPQDSHTSPGLVRRKS